LATAYYIGIHIDLFQRLEVAPCSVTAIGFTRMGPRLLAYNDTGSLSHLKPKPEETQPASAGSAPPTDQAAGNGVEASAEKTTGSPTSA
jgi:probable phosphoglycerate mutase